MSKFENATVTKAANVYFDGNVSSRTLTFADGSVKTLGFMLCGEYEFNTGDKERLEVLSGDIEVLLPGETEWLPVKGGESFDVPANSRFQIRVNELMDYVCHFIKE